MVRTGLCLSAVFVIVASMATDAWAAGKARPAVNCNQADNLLPCDNACRMATWLGGECCTAAGAAVDSVAPQWVQSMLGGCQSDCGAKCSPCGCPESLACPCQGDSLTTSLSSQCTPASCPAMEACQQLSAMLPVNFELALGGAVGKQSCGEACSPCSPALHFARAATCSAACGSSGRCEQTAGGSCAATARCQQAACGEDTLAICKQPSSTCVSALPAESTTDRDCASAAVLADVREKLGASPLTGTVFGEECRQVGVQGRQAATAEVQTCADQDVFTIQIRKLDATRPAPRPIAQARYAAAEETRSTDVDSLRAMSRQLDEMACHLEERELYQQADALRGMAAMLRNDARSRQCGPVTPTGYFGPRPNMGQPVPTFEPPYVEPIAYEMLPPPAPPYYFYQGPVR